MGWPMKKWIKVIREDTIVCRENENMVRDIEWHRGKKRVADYVCMEQRQG